jgi:mono/diheme cytochrome c family protein
MRVLAFLALILLACDNGGPLPDWSRMIDQPKLLPYGASDLTADGAAMQRPPTGTVPRSFVAGPAPASDGFPLPITRALLERGQTRFAIFCAVCHGPEGDGDSQVARSMQRRRPPSLHEPRIVALSTGKIFQVITEGYGLMPEHADQLPIADRWAVIAYLRTLQRSRAMPLAALPPAIASDVRKHLP